MKIVIIGSGIAGLAAGIRLSTSGHDVHIVEQNAFPGGKASNYYEKGFRFDLGPTLLTLPEHIDDLFHFAGEESHDYLSPQQASISCRYFFPDQTRLTAFGDAEKFHEEVAKTGEDPKNVKSYLNRQKEIYDATHKLFMESPIHKLSTFTNKQSLAPLKMMPRLNMLKTVHQVNNKSFTTPYLVQLFDRYATYNGSSPYKAPGIFTMIAHLEHTLGTYYLKDGMYSLPRALELLAQKTGVNFHYEEAVTKILYNKNKVFGIATTQHNIIEADRVISNVDVNTTYQKLLPEVSVPKRIRNQSLSNSAIIFLWGMNKTFSDLEMHNILFSEDYKKEFQEIFKEDCLPGDPTLYIYISSKAIPSDAPEGKENWHIMINVPSNKGQNWDEWVIKARQTIRKKIKDFININVDDHIVMEKVFDPRDIETRTGSWEGALYGASSNSPMSAFLRHANFSRKIKGLYFCGGSVHPGGGIPLCLLSGKITSELISQS